jgi:hypothetical protein
MPKRLEKIMTNEELEFVFDAIAEALDKSENREVFLAKLALAQANESDLACFKRALEVAKA